MRIFPSLGVISILAPSNLRGFSNSSFNCFWRSLGRLELGSHFCVMPFTAAALRQSEQGIPK
jgi:hypothetical protein